VLTIKRKLWGIAPYTTIFFPDELVFDDIVRRLRPYEMARLFYTSVSRELGDNIVDREDSLTVYINLRQEGEALWLGVPGKCRQRVRHVEKSMDRVIVERNGPRTLDAFLEVFNSFAHVKDHVEPLDMSGIERFKPYADFFVIRFDGRPMCAHAVMRDEQSARVRLLFLGSRRLEDRASAALCSDLNRYLHWHEIKTYSDEGFQIFDFGGIEDDPQNGIARFKRSFGGTVVRESSYLCAGSAVVGRIARKLREHRGVESSSQRPDSSQQIRDEVQISS
jgi:hypothetical protein